MSRELAELNRDLEGRVAERTARLEAANRDLMEKLKVDERVRQLSRAVEQSPTSVVITDLEGRIQYVNPKFTALTGYTLEEALGQNPRILKTDLTPPEDYRKLWAAITSGQEWHGEFCNKKKNGELYWESASISPVKDGNGTITHFVAVKEDITERKRADEEIHRLNQELSARAAQLELLNSELTAFSYSVSHDLRAPVRRIDGFSRALLEDYEDVLDEEGKGYLHRLRAAAVRMGQLIDDMLLLSRVTTDEMDRQRVDLSELAFGIAEELRRNEPTRDVEFVIAPGLVADGDRRLLGVVLDNLLGNAWKFTSRRQGAKIEFGATTVHGERAFFVRDNGAGFDMAYAAKLFAPFQRLHSESEFTGTGIGLATVQRVIRRHGGRIWAEGQVDAGATFYFTL